MNNINSAYKLWYSFMTDPKRLEDMRKIKDGGVQLGDKTYRGLKMIGSPYPSLKSDGEPNIINVRFKGFNNK